MATWGDLIGGSPPVTKAQGYSVTPQELTEPQSLVHASWEKGIILATAPENIPEDAAQSASDIEVDRDNSLIPSPGLALLETAAHNLKYLFQHASLDFSTELLAFDAPYMGVKGTLSFTWYNVSLVASAREWGVGNVAGTLIFSNGVDHTYTRVPGATTVGDISSQIIADCFATAFGRVFAGSVTPAGGSLQGLGLSWNATSGDFNDWTGLGSGSQLLISNQLDADRVIAMQAIGFDVLCVLTRKAIWFGTATQVDVSPASFRLRYPGLGCVYRYTAVAVPDGVMYLSDEGVVHVTLNNITIVSEQINPALLPIDYVNLKSYRAVFDALLLRYILTTPRGCWIYQLPKGSAYGSDSEVSTPGRWFFRSFLADAIALFTDQSGSVYWNTVVGSWADQLTSWAATVQGQEDAAPVLYAGKGTQLGYENRATQTYFGVAQSSQWLTPQSSKQLTDQIETFGFEIEYKCSVDTFIQLTTADTTGALSNSATIKLPNSAGARTTGIFWTQATGKGTAISIMFVRGFANIYVIRHIADTVGPTLTALGST